MKPANLAVLRALRRQGAAGLSPMEALGMTGTFRLGARIFELRRDGYVITRDWGHTPDGRRFARYVLRETAA